MSFIFNKQMPSAEEIKNAYPLPQDCKDKKELRDKEIVGIVKGEIDKFLLIVGPCSADNEDAVLDYVSRLVSLQEEVKDKIIIIPRIYTNKPRTTGEGYKGILHQPDPEKAPDMEAGLIALRKMHLRVLCETGLSAADEMLYPENHTYLDDMLSYVAIGARSVENQQHRLTVSGVDMPVGMKNPTSGDLSVMLNSVVAAQRGHTFIYQRNQVKTTGNPLAHTILRGAVNRYGQCLSNYHYEDLIMLNNLYSERELENPMVIIDASHANANKQHNEQPRIVEEVLHSRKLSGDIRKLVRGVMVESYIVEGTQKVSEHTYGKSITDPCISFETTEKLIYKMAYTL